MVRTVALALFVSVAVSGMEAQAPSAAEQELIGIEHAWVEALIKRDVAALDRLYADEYVDINPDGAIKGKAEDIAEVASGALNVASETLDEVRVRIYGTVAVVAGVYTQHSTAEGRDVSGSYRFTDVFVRRDGRWQCVSTQSTPIVNPR